MNLDVTNDTNLPSETSVSTADRLLLIKASNGTLEDVTVQNLLGSPSADGWIAGPGTWSYSSADSPSFVISINTDVTATIGVGDKIKLTQTTAKYFIVTAVGAFSGGATLVTVYGGTDYTLANAAITSPFYSHTKVPFGFNASPDKWTVTVTDTADRTQATPVGGTWYNPNSNSITIPIGVWRVSYQVAISGTSNAAQTAVNVFSTLSTANNTESDKDFSGAANNGGASGTLVTIGTIMRSKILTLAAKTAYYLNLKTTTSNASITEYGSAVGTTIIKAECAYL